MITVSPRFQAAVVQSHSVATSAVVTDLTGETRAVLSVIGGSVTADSKQVVRRSCSVTLTDPTGDLTAVNAGDLLTPYGNELTLQTGITYSDGTTELVPLGVFGLIKYGISVTHGGLVITLDGQDRSRRVARSPFVDVLVIAAGTNAGTAIQQIITSRLPGTTFSFMPVFATLPLTTYDIGKDPWVACVDIAAGLGAEVFFDSYGDCVLRPVPDPATAVVAWMFTDGPAGLAASWIRSLEDSNSANYVLVTGQNPGNTTAVSAVAQDSNPNSPTYTGGPYGTVAVHITDQTVTTNAQAQARADAELLRHQGLAEVVEGDVVCLPMLVPGDVATIMSSRAGINGRYVLDGVTYPLGPGLSKVTARRRSS